MDIKILNKFKQNILHNKKLFTEAYNNRIRILFLAFILIISWILTQGLQIYASKSKRLEEEMAANIIRFHVIANSDSKNDQYLKYQVKNTLIKALEPYFKDVNDINDARSVIEDNLPLIEEIASQVIEDNGYTYPVTASYTSTYFPMKIYGDYTFPPGTYQALQIQIGKAQGRNWWCVLFPPLCFVDETYSIVTEDSEEKLKTLLTDEEIELLKHEKVPIKIKFKLFEAIKKLFS